MARPTRSMSARSASSAAAANPRDKSTWTNHVGPIGVFDGKANYNVNWKDLDKDGPVAFDNTGGWLGFTDKYWLTALVPSGNVAASFVRSPSAGYQADYASAPVTVAPGQSTTTEARFFAGAKEKSWLDRYENAGIPKLTKAIDWGWFEFFMRPIFNLLMFLFHTFGNFGLAIIALTFIVRALMFPVAQKQFQSMAAMRKLQPKMKAIQERFKDDKQRQQQEILKLYQTEKVNPRRLPAHRSTNPGLLRALQGAAGQRRNAPPAFHPVDQGPLRARSADADQPIRAAPLHAAGASDDRDPADPCGPNAIPVDEAQSAGDGPGATADFHDHAVDDDPHVRAVRGGASALLDHQQCPHDCTAVVAVPKVRTAPQRHASGRHMSDAADHELAERARKLFAGPVEFLKSAPELKFLPDPTVPEIAFAGRSNVGKSSLLNALTNRNGLARTSNTPGRTQELNFFDVGEPLQLRLVDMPGYGFAEAPKDLVRRWRNLVNDYLRGRAVLKRALVLIDSRHGLKQPDRDMMDMLDAAAVNYQLVLTKADKVKPSALGAIYEGVASEARKHAAAHPGNHHDLQ